MPNSRLCARRLPSPPWAESRAENFAKHGDIGATVVVFIDDRAVVDLWGGFLDAVTAMAENPHSLLVFLYRYRHV